jgi:hypothetical protein
MKSVASVTLLNLEGVQPVEARVLPGLKCMWWVDENSHERLAKKLHFATFSSIKFKGKETKEKLTMFEKRHISMVVSLFNALPPL